MPSLVRDKRGIFYIVRSVDGKRKWCSTRTRDRSEAYRVYLKATTRASKEETQQPQKTLSHHVEDYLSHVKANHGVKTYNIYALALRHFVRWTGDVPVEAITPRTIDMFKVKRLETVSPATVNNNLRAVKTFFNCLKRWDLIVKSPAEGSAPIRIVDQVPAYLTIDQLEFLLGTMNDKWLQPIVLFAAMSGARLGEILHLNWNQVDLVNRVALIQSSVSYQVKCGKVRSIPLNETACRVLMVLPSREGLVFRGKRGGPANPNHVSRSFRRAARKAGLDKRLHFHSLRHTFASLLVQSGVSLYHVQKLLGHSSCRVTEVYAHLQSAKLHHVVNTISVADAAHKWFHKRVKVARRKTHLHWVSSNPIP